MQSLLLLLPSRGDQQSTLLVLGPRQSTTLLKCSPESLTCNCLRFSAAAAFSSAVFRRLAAGTYTVPPAAAAACPTMP